VEGEDENWRDKEESLEFAVLEAATDVERAKKASFCIRQGGVKNMQTAK
jgi:hypothetical protein